MNKCKVSKQIVAACNSLIEVSEAVTQKKHKGIFEWRYANLKTGKISRSFFGAKNEMHRNGLVFNFCPYCGVNILRIKKVKKNE